MRAMSSGSRWRAASAIQRLRAVRSPRADDGLGSDLPELVVDASRLLSQPSGPPSRPPGWPGLEVVLGQAQGAAGDGHGHLGAEVLLDRPTRSRRVTSSKGTPRTSARASVRSSIGLRAAGGVGLAGQALEGRPSPSRTPSIR